MRAGLRARTIRTGMLTIVAAVVMAVMLVAAPAMAGAAVRAYPDLTGLASSTHPVDTTWYRSRAVSFSWDATSAYTGYSYAIDSSATAPTLDLTRDALTPRFSWGASTTVSPIGMYPPSFDDGVVADFNGDGILDVAQVGMQWLYVFLGNGDGTFTEKPQPPILAPYLSLYWNGREFEGRELVAADFDKDGAMDLALAGASWKADYLVLNGAGDGTFAISGGAASGWLSSRAGETWTVGRSIVAADFDGDTKLDLAMSLETSPGVVAVYPGTDPLGTFGAGTALRVSGTVDVVRDLAAGDLDGDGCPELVGVVGYDSAARIAIWDNTGGALTTLPVLDVPTWRDCSDVEIAEMDGDGAPEIVASSNDNDYYKSGVMIYHGDLATGFTGTGLAPLSYEAINDLKVVDINADGILDVVGLNVFGYGNESAGIEYYLNDGAGGFTGPVRYRAWSNSVRRFGLGDFDGNGLVDFLTLTPPDDPAIGPSTRLVPWLGAAGAQVTAPADGTHYVHVRGVNGGSAGPVADVRVRIDSTGPSVTVTGTTDGAVYLSGSVPAAAFMASDPLWPDSSGVAEVHWGDTGGGGGVVSGARVDLTLPSTPGVYVYWAHGVDAAGNQGAETSFVVTVLGDVAGLVSPTHPDASESYPATTAGFAWTERSAVGYSYQLDQDPNGVPDLVPDRFRSRLTPVLAPVSYPASASAVPPATGDFNRDGRIDIAVADSDGTGVRILLNRGGGFSSSGSDHYYDTGTYPQHIRAADLDGDGALDLVFTNSEPSSIGVMRGNGDGSFRSPVSISQEFDSLHIATGDFDGDGRAEAACANWMSSFVIVDWNGEAFTASYRTLKPGVAGCGSIAAGDLDGDGHLDVVLGTSSGEILIARNDGAGTFAGSSITTQAVSALPYDMELADLGRDGKLDLVINSPRAETFIIMKGDGAGGFGAERVLAATGSGDFALGDLTGDGVLDLAQWVPAEPTAIRTWIGDGSGWFGGPTDTGAASPGWTGITAADLDGDGYGDVAAIDDRSQLEVFRGWDRRSNVTFDGLAPGTYYFHVREVGSRAGARTSTIRINVGDAYGQRVGELLFGANSSALTARARANLKRIAWLAKARGTSTVYVRGYTAYRDRGSVASRTRLSLARAKRAKAYLEARLRAIGYRANVVAIGEGDAPGVTRTRWQDRKAVISLK